MPSLVQRVGLGLVLAGAIGVGVVALVLVVGLQGDLSDTRLELADAASELASRRTEAGDLRGRLEALEVQLDDEGPVVATAARVESLETRLLELEEATAAPDGGVIHEVLTARQFVLVDDSGQERAFLRTDRLGHPALRLAKPPDTPGRAGPS